jgi:hypothetical protein
VDKDGIKESLIGLPFFFFVLFLSEEEEGGATRKEGLEFQGWREKGTVDSVWIRD